VCLLVKIFKYFDDGVMRSKDRAMSGCMMCCIQHIHICSALQQQLYTGGSTIGGTRVQCCGTTTILGINVCPALKEKLDRVNVTLHSKRVNSSAVSASAVPRYKGPPWQLPSGEHYSVRIAHDNLRALSQFPAASLEDLGREKACRSEQLEMVANVRYAPTLSVFEAVSQLILRVWSAAILEA
jgi:hypothetical protein